jgi:hypothetical protein
MARDGIKLIAKRRGALEHRTPHVDNSNFLLTRFDSFVHQLTLAGEIKRF